MFESLSCRGDSSAVGLIAWVEGVIDRSDALSMASLFNVDDPVGVIIQLANFEPTQPCRSSRATFNVLSAVQ